MNYYTVYRPNQKHALSPALDTKSKEYNPNDDDLSDCLEIITKDRKENRPHLKICARCETRSMVNTRVPYCMDCGWDALEDPSWSHDE